MLLTWKEAALAGPTVAGGKGWNLGRMSVLGFPVPEGVVVPASIREIGPELRQALQPWSERCLAVRSSATLEDGVKASFAGIHESVLNVQGAQALEEAIQTCWASTRSERARAYRAHHKIPEDQGECAVVLCDMLPAELAGVAFTFDPVSGERDRMVLEFVPGLADDLVQGKVAPSRLVLGLGRDDYPILDGSGPGVLHPDQWQQFARLLDRLNWALGQGQDPLDLEWVFAKDQFWIVQARPATKPARATFAALRGQPVLWTNANMQDSVPGVVSTLTWSLVRKAVDRVLYASLRACGYEVPAGLEAVRRFEGRGYFDSSAMQWAFHDALGLPPQAVTEQIGGFQPCIQVRAEAGWRARWGRAQRGLRLLAKLWRFSYKLPRQLEQHRGRHLELESRLGDPSQKSLQDLHHIVRQFVDNQAELETLAGMSNASSGVCYDALQQNLKSIFKDDAQDMSNRLLAGGGGVTSAEHAYRIYDLAQLAESESLAQPEAWRELRLDSRFRAEMDRFFRDFGHRAVYEAEISNPRWLEDPGFVFGEIDRWRKEPVAKHPRQIAHSTRQEAEAELRRRAGWRTGLLFFLLGRVRLGFALREKAKSEMVRGMLVLRRVLLEVGQRLHRAGKLQTPAQVFELCYADLIAYLKQEWDGTGAQALTSGRQLQRQAWLQCNPPGVIQEGQQQDFSPVPAGRPSGGTLWQGQGVSGGLVTGPARILRSPEEGHRLASGDILLAATTDPGWTPVFLRAGAIVVETGGFLSHGAIVAREFGLPAVVNVEGILEAISDGTMIEVDGRRGTVRRLS